MLNVIYTYKTTHAPFVSELTKKILSKHWNTNTTRVFGADDGKRTRDLILTKDVRYRLCHISKFASGFPDANWRRHPESNWGIKVLQTSALPLGYGAGLLN